MSDYLNSEAEDDEPTAPFWMTTFSDMVTLLLTFFVLIVAMSEVEVKKFKEALSYFQGRPSMLTHDAVTPPMREQQVTTFRSREQAERYEELMRRLQEQGLQGKVQVNMTDKGVHVVITDSVMFNSGEAKLIEPSRTVLRMISGLLAGAVASVIVEGHTDDRPIRTSVYPSNWELSAARASSVVRFLLEQEGALDPSNYIAVGHGEHRPLDVRPTPEGRARNRRVEMLFSWESWPKQTPPLSMPAPLAEK